MSLRLSLTPASMGHGQHIRRTRASWSQARAPQRRRLGDRTLLQRGPRGADVIETCVRHFPNVVAVDDGSQDNSATEILAPARDWCSIPVNIGRRIGYQTGIEFALRDPEAEFFVTFDADGQHQVDDVVDMVTTCGKPMWRC